MIHRLKINSEEEYYSAYKKSIENPELFWDEIAENFLWQKKWTKTLEWDFTIPKVKWFIGGKLNITENCLDRYLNSQGDKTAIIWDGEPGESSFGRLAQGFLEGSNVDMSEELTNLILAQRGFEMNARVLQAADEIMNIINNLRR